MNGLASKGAPLVGFGEGKTKGQRDANGAIFKSVLITNNLTRLD
jgi:hypothetical protein